MILAAAIATATAVAASPTILEYILQYLSLITFAYVLLKDFKGSNKEKEKELKSKLEHLENQCILHSDMHKRAQQEREHLVDKNNDRMIRLESEVKELHSLRTDVETIKTKQEVMFTQLSTLIATVEKLNNKVDKLIENK